MLYELPPLPPNEIFDVRYEDNTFVSNYIGVKNIVLNSPKLPLKIRLFNFDGDYIKISDAISGKIFSDKLYNDKEIILDKNLQQLKLTISHNPLRYELLQNFPNPFNPKTTITFYIPESNFVELSVFNPLGQQMEILLKERLVAGVYSVNFNADKYPSGFYFYTLKAGNFLYFEKDVVNKVNHFIKGGIIIDYPLYYQ